MCVPVCVCVCVCVCVLLAAVKVPHQHQTFNAPRHLWNVPAPGDRHMCFYSLAVHTSHAAAKDNIDLYSEISTSQDGCTHASLLLF